MNQTHNVIYVVKKNDENGDLKIEKQIKYCKIRKKTDIKLTFI